MPTYSQTFESGVTGDPITDGIYWFAPTPNDLPWLVSEERSYGGIKCLQSGAIGYSQVSRVQLIFSAVPYGNLTFRYWLECDSAYDKLEFIVNGLLTLTVSGNSNPGGWTEHTHANVTPGARTYEWKFTRGAAGGVPFNAVYLDEINLDIYQEYVGTLSVIEQDDSSSIVAFTPPLGFFDTTEDVDAMAFSGYTVVYADMPAVEQDDSAGIICVHGVAGQVVATEESDTAAYIGYSQWPLTYGVVKSILYKAALSGYQAGLSDINLAISSWSANKRTLGSNYLSCTIPYSSETKALIQARSTGLLTVVLGNVYVDDSVLWTSVISVPLQTIRYDQGAKSSSITLSGNATRGTTPAKSIALTGISNKSESNGSLVITGEVNLFAEVGDTATYLSDSFLVDSIGYMVSTTQSTMQVSQA